MELEQFVVTVRRFDPDRPHAVEHFDLPVDSPDAEHAVSAAMSNAVAFTTKVEDGALASVAFQAIGIRTR